MNITWEWPGPEIPPMVPIPGRPYATKWSIKVTPPLPPANQNLQMVYEGTKIPTIHIFDLDPGKKYQFDLTVDLDYFNVTFADVTSTDVNTTIIALVEPRDFAQTEDIDLDLLLLVDNSDAVDNRNTIVAKAAETVKFWNYRTPEEQKAILTPFVSQENFEILTKLPQWRKVFVKIIGRKITFVGNC